MARPPNPDVMRAAKLSHVPGVTIAEACARFGVGRAAVARARKAPEAVPSLAELALAALTKHGTRSEGEIAELAGVASWIDYINHDGSTADDIRALLAPLVTFDGTRWSFAGRWP